MIEPFFFLRKNVAPTMLVVCALMAGNGCSVPGQTSAHGLTENRQNPFTEAAQLQEPPAIEAQTQSPADVFDELQSIGEIDPLARQKLTNDLRAAKPEHWPLMVQQFKSALAYRRQLAERESSAVADTPVADTHMVGQPPHLAAKTQAVGMSLNPGNQPSVEVSPNLSNVVLSNELPAIQQVAAQVSQSLPPPPVERVSAPMVAETVQNEVKQATYAGSVPTLSSPWHDDLGSVISRLETSVSPTPGSTDEVHEHMRLRMLYMLAGRDSDSMLPIPGATPAQQDYWAKQLFAMSSFLDTRQQPDDKQRASGSLVYLDQARAKLAELASLQIRNLAFVESVDGYGVYKRHEQQEFRSGDPVTLYAEVQNFRSESTKEGYRTTLSTSYEVLDTNGKRVDGRQFPDVEDLCQNQRCDFHMQYGVALPTRIYPGEYQLRLTITDQLSHKIGQTSVPFTIVE